MTNDDEVAERLRFLQNAMGGVPGPFDCFLVLRGLRTLAAADGAARRRTPWRSPGSSRSRRRRVGRYPGLDDGPQAHPGYAMAARQMRLGDGRRSAGWSRSCRRRRRRRPLRAERAVAICEPTRLFTLAESLGGVESLIEVPGRDDPCVGRRVSRWPCPALVRLSVGIEDAAT